MGVDGGAVGAELATVDVGGGVGLALQGGQQGVPDVPLAPAVEAVEEAASVAVAAGQVAPDGAGREDPENAVAGAAVVQGAGAAALALIGGQQGLEAVLCGVGQRVPLGHGTSLYGGEGTPILSTGGLARQTLDPKPSTLDPIHF